MTDVTHILEGLNDQQREAVIAKPGPLLVTAGAGSGKTTVLIRRIAWLIEVFGVSKHQIMAVTFTNKAARQMKSRVEDMLGMYKAPRWMGTFHGLSNLLLRIYHKEAGLDSQFTIIDSQDQKSLINRLIRDSRLPVGGINPRQFQSYINRAKEDQLRSMNLEPTNHRQQVFVQVYEKYEQSCNKRGLVDFAELLLRTVEVMKRNQLVREEMQARFAHIIVDEFQDTSAIQLEWLKLFCGQNNQITAVGDEDQSIYGWRGAISANMLKFAKNFSGTEIVYLEQNYRSTQTILNAANAVIQNNGARYKKKLWTSHSGGETVKLFSAYDANQEASFVAEEIKQKRLSFDFPYSNFAVLYRTNAQSRMFEEVFVRKQIPYRIYGGLRFYERKEIKDVLAYLRLLIDPNNNESFSRVINFPRRGIGDKSQSTIREFASIHNLSFWESSLALVESSVPRMHFRAALARFVNLVRALKEESVGEPFDLIISKTIELTGIKKFYDKNSIDTDVARIENLEELINAGANFAKNSNIEDGVGAIRPFLDGVTLDSDDKHDENGQDAVQVMTLHSSKGLEFPVVFLVGADEKLLPHELSIKDSTKGESEIEEERRLFYVGMTRAEQQLYLTRAKFRMIQGKTDFFYRSRFLREIPSQYLEEVTLDGITSAKNQRQSPNDRSRIKDVYALQGERIHHQAFGEGKVLKIASKGKFPIIKVNFYNGGTKILVWDPDKIRHIN